MRLMRARWFWRSLALLLVLVSAVLARAIGSRDDQPQSPIECRALHDLIKTIDDYTIEARDGLVARLQCAGATSLVVQLQGRFVIDGELRTDLERAAQAGDLDAAFALATKVSGVTSDTLAQLYPTVVRDTVRALGDRYAHAIVLTTAALAADLAAIFLPSGPGIAVRPVAGAWLVDFVQAGSSGELMGLLPGDRIERVGGVPVADLRATMDEVLDAQVDLEITRTPWTEPLVVTVGGPPYRPLTDVEYDVLPGGIGYLRFRLFFSGLTPMFIRAMHALAARGARSLLLDLRGNGGGAINEAVALADVLVPGKPAIAGVEARDATFALPNSGLRESYHAAGEAMHKDWDMVVLLDRSSASATEFLAGCLRQNGRALIVGEQSFGKGIGQMGLPVVTSQPGSFLPFTQVLLLTVCRLRLPDGSSIHGVGLRPDVTSRAPPRSRAALARVVTWCSQPRHREQLAAVLANGEQALALAEWDPGEALPEGLLEDAAANAPRDLIEWLRCLARACVTRTERRCVTDPSRDSVLRRGIEVLLVHRGDDRHALDADLPPLVEWH